LYKKQKEIMKTIIIPSLLFLFLTAANFAQTGKAAVLENLEQSNSSVQLTVTTATLRSATRLFGEKDDLTAVIFVIPSGSTVQVLSVDSTYLYVKYEDTEGYIFNKNVTFEQVASSPVSAIPVEKAAEPLQQVTQVPQSTISESRFTLLENKYGTSLAARLYAGKIWKGMSAEMVKDSWGTPGKINRSISLNLVREEWIYNNTWLFFEADKLIEWGPVNR
jgi:hypothetical protein